jgi:hypothetical protein
MFSHQIILQIIVGGVFAHESMQKGCSSALLSESAYGAYPSLLSKPMTTTQETEILCYCKVMKIFQLGFKL